MPWPRGAGLGAARRCSARSRPRCGARRARDPGGPRAPGQWIAPRAAVHGVRAGRRSAPRACPRCCSAASGERGPAADEPVSRSALRALRPRGAARGQRARRRRPTDATRPPSTAPDGHRHAAQRAARLGGAAARRLAAAARAARRARRASSAPAAAACRSRRWLRWLVAAARAAAARLAVAARRSARRRPDRRARRAVPPRPPCRSRRAGSSRSSRRVARRRARRGSALAAAAIARARGAPRGERGRPGGLAAATGAVAVRARGDRLGRQPVRRGAAAARRAPVAVRRRARLAPARLVARSPRRRRRCCRSLLVVVYYAPRARPRPARARVGRCCRRRPGTVSVAVASLVGGVLACLRRAAGDRALRRRVAGDRGPGAVAPAARSATPGRARSAAPSRRCGDERAAARRSRDRAACCAALSTVLIVAGALLLADAGATLLWQEPVSALYAHVQQSKLDRRADRARARAARRRSSSARSAQLPDPHRRLAFARARWSAPHRDGRRARPASGSPRIGVSPSSSRARTPATCARAPATTRPRRCPGSAGPSAIAGHRTTYGAPFRKIDKLRPGDQIERDDALRPLHLPRRAHPDRAADRRLWSRSACHDRLILSACHPLYSAAKRIVVFARLVRATARCAAREIG